MTYSEAKEAVEKLQGKMDSSFSNADKKKIEELYFEVLRKTFVHTSCQQCYHDAVIEMLVYMRKYRKLKTKCNYRMRAGFIISCPDFYAGKIFTNDNLTDKVAKEYLEKYPKQETMFSEIPDEELIENKKNADGTAATGGDEGSEGDSSDHDDSEGKGDDADQDKEEGKSPATDPDKGEEAPSDGGNDDEDE